MWGSKPGVALERGMRDDVPVLWDDPVTREAATDSGPSVVDRVLLVLESCAVSNRALTLGELAKLTGMPKSTLHRMCWKLVELGMLERTNSAFRIGTKVFALGSMNPALRRLRATAMPYLHELVGRTGWATNLAVLADGRALVVEEVFGGQARAMRRMVGARLPLHATAIGKALLSGYADAELDELLERGLRPYTGTTIVRANLLREQIAAVRHAAVAFSHEEWSAGTSGVASPVVADGAVVAAVAVVGEPGEVGMRQRSAAVKHAAAGIGGALSRAPLAAIS
jgi:DNA-binding IclR family transcriptional regulator